MKYCTNFLYGVMQTNWSIRRIKNLFGVNSAVARMYFQPCATPNEVNEILAAIANLAD